MDQPEGSNGFDKSWDHPWTTHEMRQKKQEWSLAADVGLLEHLKQFSNNLMENVEKTKEKLNSLTSDLNETTVIVDNITNASLAVANTQFIESRVREDDVETKHKSQTGDDENINGEEIKKEDLIGSVSESIKQGLIIMDEKFQRWEVDASDSEDEGETPIPSFILRPKDPYQNRPLPYVIGSDKWKSSNKVGLESSSSESEAPEGDEESASQEDEQILQSDMMVNNRRESMLRTSSSSSSGSSDRNERGNTVKHYSGVSSTMDKLKARSQDTLNSGSEIVTPTVAQSETQNIGKGAPSFAEELAKRLGNVLPSGNPIRNSQETDQASINRSKDDLFGPDNGDVFGSNSENPFTDSGNLFDTEVSSSLWKDRLIRVPKTNIIPPCLDVPPPIHDDASKPRSAFDDLCGDADSEDSDDLFARKPSPSNFSRKPSFTSGIWPESEDSREHKFLKIVQTDNPTNIATSTPEINDIGGAFGGASAVDDDDLFGNPGKSMERRADGSAEATRTATKSKPQGLPITQADILSSNLGSRLFQRVPRQDSTDSSDSETSLPISRANKPTIFDDSNQNSAVSNPNKSEPSSIVAGNANSFRANVEESDSSGISIRPNSTGNTFGLGADFQPQLESTRLRSEEIYRERVASDSLFAPRTNRPSNVTNSTNNSINPILEIRVPDSSNVNTNDNFDSDDVFGPPPLSNNVQKSKSVVDTLDDLFSNASSGTRSQPKISDTTTVVEPQSVGKSTVARNTGLFDEDIDIFGDVAASNSDIFNVNFTSDVSSSKINEIGKSKIDESSSKKSADLFSITSNEIADDFGWSGVTKTIDRKSKKISIFDDSEEDNDDDDLFGSSFVKRDRAKPDVMPRSNEDDDDDDDNELFGEKTKITREIATETKKLKKDSISEIEREAGTSANVEKFDANSHVETTVGTKETPLTSYPSGGLFDGLNDDDDDDSLFDDGKIKDRENLTKIEIEKKLTKKIGNVDSMRSVTKQSKFSSNFGDIDDSSKTIVEEFGERERSVSDDDGTSKKRSTTSPSLTKKNTDESSLKNVGKKETKNYDDVSTIDGAIISKSRDSSEGNQEIGKRVPPKTLSIRLPMASGQTEDSGQPPRRVLSSKIKNLTDKMGDFKYLSPTDTPPLWKKSETKTDVVGDDTTGTIEGESSIGLTRSKTPVEIFGTIEDFGIVAEKILDAQPSSPHDDSGNSESAVSFDIPAQIETLAVTASKSRARIQAKRRPQSRHARHSALRKSGIDFDGLENSSADAGESDPSDNTPSVISDKVSTVATDSIDGSKTIAGTDNRLVGSGIVNDSIDKTVETSSTLPPDDRSEISMSKGSSMSINKNTLLSPSTDEEDLFDVPPDLPEDPPKEDTIFGRAPILSPTDGFPGPKNPRNKDRFKTKNLITDAETSRNDRYPEKIVDSMKSREITDSTKTQECESNEKEMSLEIDSSTKKQLDPLRDNSHDPLKDPSQLFAFVTKTPSPEKGQNVSFKEDDSLFVPVTNKIVEQEKTTSSTNAAMDLFADDSGGDLFAGPIAKTTKNSIKIGKIGSLFDDTDAEDDRASDLFGSSGSASGIDKFDRSSDVVSKKSNDITDRASPGKKSSVFTDDTDRDLFVDARGEKSSPEVTDDKLFPATSKISKDSKFNDLFGDHSSGEDDIFAPKKIIGAGKSSASGSLFPVDTDDEDANDIFAKKSVEKMQKIEGIENRGIVKKSVTRDLKKTAEKIVEDPLSMLQDD